MLFSLGFWVIFLLFEVKKEKSKPIVKTKAENIDKNDKEILKALSDKLITTLSEY